VKKEEIHLWDIKRILLGQASAEFLVEVLIRSLIIYLLALVAMRLLGKRMNGQLTIVELAVMVMMGAIIAVPMQMPDKGILQGFVILLIVLFLHRGLNLIAFKNTRFEKTLQGELTILIKDGVLQLKELEQTKISKPQLFAELRNKKVYNLARVKRMYLEGCGTYSIYTEEETKPGLLLFPKKDESIIRIQKKAQNAQVCSNCGWVVSSKDPKRNCPNCEKTDWIEPIF
jgi:uncharacterized membrane protein YcaP (DUF421 family)